MIKIKNIANFVKRGIAPTYADSGYIVLNQKCIRNGIINTSLARFTSNGKKYSEEKFLQDKDILINSTGTGTLGRVALYRSAGTNTYLVDSHITILRCQNCEPVFVYHYLTTIQNYIETLGKGSTNQLELGSESIKDIEIPEFSIKTQIKIASILDNYNYMIENNQKQIKLLEEAAQRLYKEWFVDLHFPGYEDTEIVDGVPEGWTERCVSDFGEVITGKTPSTAKAEYYGGNIPFVTIPDMHGKVFPLTTEKALTKAGADTQKGKYLPKNTVIVSCIATVGLVNIATEMCQTNQQINSVILTDKKDLYFFYESMKRIKALLDGVGSNGATMTNVNKTKFSNIKVLYPTEVLVSRYYDFCLPIFDKILNLSVAMQDAQQSRDRLLPKLMSGELEV